MQIKFIIQNQGRMCSHLTHEVTHTGQKRILLHFVPLEDDPSQYLDRIGPGQYLDERSPGNPTWVALNSLEEEQDTSINKITMLSYRSDFKAF